MATVANNQYYYIISAASLFTPGATPMALDVSGGTVREGTNVQTWGVNRTDAQVWVASQTTSGGYRRLTSRLCGKMLTVDTSNIGEGSNVIIKSNTNTGNIGQILRFSDSGYTMTYDGTTYPCFYIELAQWNPSTYGIGLNTPLPQDGTNVVLKEKAQASSTYQLLWVFVPIEDFRPGGVHEIVPITNTSLRVDVTARSEANGSNVSIQGAANSNYQKYYITQASGVEGGWTVRNIATGKYIDVAGDAAREDANVQVWDADGTRSQKWELVPYGDSTQTIEGQRCGLYRLRSYVNYGSSTAYYMDVKNAMTARNSNVLIHTQRQAASDLNSNLFALLPTYAVDPRLPVPEVSVGSTSNAAAATRRTLWPFLENYPTYPFWTIPSSFLSAYDTHYEIRWRTRRMNKTMSTWGAWEEWNNWITAPTNISGNRAASQIGTGLSSENRQYKAGEIQYQIRAVSTNEDGTSLLAGRAGSATVRLYNQYTLTLTQLVWTPEGLRVAWQSEYDAGTTEILFTSIKTRTGSKQLLKQNVLLTSSTFESSGLIPQEMLTEWITSETEVILEYYAGYDLAHASDKMASDTGSSRVVATITQTGGTAYIEPSISWDGPRLYATISSVGPTSMWVKLSDGSLWECPFVRKYGSNNYIYEVIYPTGEEYDLLISSADSTGEIWSVTTYHMSAVESRVHAFYWGDNKVAFLEHFEVGGESYQETREAVYEADVLDDRPLESVSSTHTVKTRFTIGGTISAASYSSIDDVKAMVNEHVIWRGPNTDDFADVFIAQGTFTERNNRTEVTLTAIKETR